MNILWRWKLKALITYYSESGNTKKVAEGIYDGLTLKNKTISDISNVQNLDDYDIIFCGFPVYDHSVPPKMQAFLKAIPSGSNIAFFSTHGVHTNTVKSKTAFEVAGTLVGSSRILGTFGTRGKVEESVREAYGDKLVNKSWTDESITAVGHPNESDIEDAKQFAAKMLEKIKTYAA